MHIIMIFAKFFIKCYLSPKCCRQMKINIKQIKKHIFERVEIEKCD